VIPTHPQAKYRHEHSLHEALLPGCYSYRIALAHVTYGFWSEAILQDLLSLRLPALRVLWVNPQGGAIQVEG